MGDRFADALLDAEARLVRLAGPASDDLRRLRVHRFPYTLIYVVLDEEMLVVLAVHHDRKRPVRWAARRGRT